MKISSKLKLIGILSAGTLLLTSFTLIYLGMFNPEAGRELIQNSNFIWIASGILILFAIIILVLGYRIAGNLSFSMKALGETLQESAKEFESGGGEYGKIIDSLKSLDFDTSEGVLKAYDIIHKLIEQAREDRTLAMEESEAKSIFLASMSHEIRTPMNGIIGFTELLRNTKATEEQQEYISIIEKSSQNLLNIINNILDLSRIESKNVELEHVTFDTHEILDDTIESFSVQAEEKGLDFNCFIDPAIGSKLKGDPTKIREILSNLLDNAIKFTDRKGEIDVEIRKLESVENGLSRVKFSIRDTGIGMDDMQLKNIFQPFSQADINITRKYGGTGLGLTITKEYIELMGGDLRVESISGSGSTFHFILILEEVQSETPDLEGTFKKLKLCRPRVDNRFYKYLDEYARYFGVEIIQIDSGSDLHQAFSENRCSYIIIEELSIPAQLETPLKELDRESLLVIGSTRIPQEIEKWNIPKRNFIAKPLTYKKVVELFKSLTKFEAEEKKSKEVPKIPTRFSGKILVVEDNIINQKLVENILTGLGLEVDIAKNGLEAFEKRKREEYDLIFMDIQMPVMDGIEATHRILAYEEEEKEVKHIPIVALTANALKGDRERFLSEGMDEYVSKPVEISELIYILNKFLHDKAGVSLETGNAPASRTEPAVDTTDREAREISYPEIVIAKNLPFSRKLLSKMMEALGHQYRIAENSEETAKLIHPGASQIIFADESMLSQDALDRIRESQAVVVFTMEPEKRDRFNGIDYTIYNGKMTKENFESFLKTIRGKQ